MRQNRRSRSFLNIDRCLFIENTTGMVICVKGYHPCFCAYLRWDAIEHSYCDPMVKLRCGG